MVAPFPLVVSAVYGFVLSGSGNVAPNALPGRAWRWTVPHAASDIAGLGGGISWVLSDDFCTQMLGRFQERDLFYGVEVRY